LLAECSHGCWSFELMGKVAFGKNQQEVTIAGATVETVPGFGSAFFNQGLFAQPSNIGTYERRESCVLPEVQINAKYQVCRCLRVTAGYTFMYLSDVLRPADQIDFVIDSSLPPNPQRPIFTFNSDDMWVQGVSGGVELSF
jgi:hypothetical protein